MDVDVSDNLIDQLRQRAAFGRDKYQSDGLHPFDGRNTVKDAKEELCDLFVYLHKLELERAAAADLLQAAARHISMGVLNGGRQHAAMLDKLNRMEALLRDDIRRIGDADHALDAAAYVSGGLKNKRNDEREKPCTCGYGPEGHLAGSHLSVISGPGRVKVFHWVLWPGLTAEDFDWAQLPDGTWEGTRKSGE